MLTTKKWQSFLRPSKASRLTANSRQVGCSERDQHPHASRKPAEPTDVSIARAVNKYTAYFCTAVMTGLAANISYTYRVGNSASGTWSQPFTFVNEPQASGKPLVFAVYADFGFKNDESLPSLIKDAAAGGFDFVIHAGEYPLQHRSIILCIP